MTLDADLERLTLHGKKKTFDPVSDASKQGRVPTLGEVKKSLKVRDRRVERYTHADLAYRVDVDQESDPGYNSDGYSSE